MDTKIKQEKKYRRQKRVRAKIKGTAKMPRFCVFRSNKHIYAQIIDDEKGKTLGGCSDKEIKISELQLKTKNLKQEIKEKDQEKEIIRTRKVAIAYQVGILLAEKAIKNKIKKIVFDRRGYKYHGRIKATADGARKAGLLF